MVNLEKRPVKLIANFVKFVKNKASEDGFPYDNISKSLTIATSIFWKEWDNVKNNQEQRTKFLTRVRQEAKELEVNGFLHNSRGIKKIGSRPSSTLREKMPATDLIDPELLEKKSTEHLNELYKKFNTRRNLTDMEYEFLLKIHSILTERSGKYTKKSP